MDIRMTPEETEAYRAAIKHTKEYEELKKLLEMIPAPARSREEVRRDLFGEGFEELQREIKEYTEKRRQAGPRCPGTE